MEGNIHDEKSISPPVSGANTAKAEGPTTSVLINVPKLQLAQDSIDMLTSFIVPGLLTLLG